MSAAGSYASVQHCPRHVRFSNRPFGVKRFQTIHHCNVDVAHGLVLLFGIGTGALPSWDSKTGWNNLYRGLAVRRTAGPSAVSYTHLRAHETDSYLVCRLLLEKKKKTSN